MCSKYNRMLQCSRMIRLSPSTLNLYKDCPRCFWLHMNEKISRPRGIFPSLPSSMDLVIKDYFDTYRGALPPELEGNVEGVLLEDLTLLAKWRNWRTGLTYYDKNLDAQLSGALDDCLVVQSANKKGNTLFAPLDYKTRGSAPKEGGSEAFYQHQLDAYALLLEANGYPSTDFAYLVYYYPKEVHEYGTVNFFVKSVRLETSKDRARALFESAIRFLQGEPPSTHNGKATCEYCSWHRTLMDIDG